SYFNRESAATRIPGATMTNALVQIIQQGHREPAHALVILVGHSFGGLVLERALTQAMIEQVIRQATENNICPSLSSTSAGTQQGGGPVSGNASNVSNRLGANLVVFLNSAAAATEAKQMLD